MTDAWGSNIEKWGAALLLGVALFHLNYPDADPGVLREQLSRRTPHQLASEARTLQKSNSGDRAAFVAQLVLEAYNRGPAARLGELRVLSFRQPHKAGTIASAKQVDIAERRQRVAELTRTGHSAAEIGRQLRIHPRQVVRDRMFLRRLE